MPRTVLITGAAGRVGSFLRPRLRGPQRRLRLLDIDEITDPDGTEEVVTGSITDLAVLQAACAGVTAVVHLAGFSGERSWSEILHTNINGTWCVLEAARAAGVNRVVLAGSNHAVGFAPRTDDPLPDDAFPRPDTYYGVGKVTMEALGSLYADRHGMDVVCLRIGSCMERPPDVRGLSTWLSPDDAGRLVEAALSASATGFRVVWGVSNNTRRWWSTAGGDALGYHPVDDAETYAAEVLAAEPPESELSESPLSRVGGQWARRWPA